MVYSLLFSLPGVPVLFYGEEIGMGENTEIQGRTSVRTPMQWSNERNGGFSSAAPSRLVAPPPSDGYGPRHVNVADQVNDEESMLHFIRRLTARYRISPEIGWGALTVLEHDCPSVLVHVVSADVGRCGRHQKNGTGAITDDRGVVAKQDVATCTAEYTIGLHAAD